eukprot:GEMP01022881.1.p1 GENE.GEMP01022881.1~~GEMP01022881.1.p1  ORF type:complete len:235 (-),score=26.02 GEMP01022881.1:1512-2216(-)
MDDDSLPNPESPQLNVDADSGFKFEHLYGAWRNEKLAPELLPYQADLLHDQQDLCNIQEDSLRVPPVFKDREDLQTNARDYFMQHDLARYQWLIRSYLRLRITKLENYAMYYREHPIFLSSQEKRLVGELLEYEKQQYEQMCLKSLDSRIRSGLMTLEIMPKPDLEQFVFIEVAVPETTIFINSESQPLTQGASQPNLSFTQEPITLKKGDKFFILYSQIRDKLLENPPAVFLI